MSGDGRREVWSRRHPGRAASGGGRPGEARSSRHRGGDVTDGRLQRNRPHNGFLPLRRNWRKNYWTIQVYQVKHVITKCLSNNGVAACPVGSVLAPVTP